jgi:hypothetical protein
MTADPVGNLRKRPPLSLIGIIGTTPNPYQNKFFDYQRAGEATYLFELQRDGSVKAWDTNGNTYPVTNNAQLYLTSSNPSRSIAVTNIQDLTVLCNTSRVVKEVPVVQWMGGSQVAYLEVTGSTWATEFTVVIARSDGTEETVSYRTPTGIDKPEEEAKNATASYVVDMLLNGLENKSVSPVGRDGNIIYFTQSGYRVKEVRDTNGNSFIRFTNGKISDVKQLPSRAIHGEVVEVVPSNLSEFGKYYLRFERTVPSALPHPFGDGRWVESTKKGLTTEISTATMPVAMVRLQQPDGSIYFCINQLDGSEVVNLNETYQYPKLGTRNVGDDDSNPMPSFVGEKISTIGSYQGRVLFVSKDNISFSRSDDYWDFFYETALEVTDSDPIDIGTGASSTSTIEKVAYQDGDLVLFSKTDQFVIYGDKVLTPNTAVVVPATSFEASLVSDPVASGRSLYFPTTYGQFSGIREFRTDTLSATRDAPPITAHVSDLILGEVTKIVTANIAGQLFVITEGFDSRIYSYEYLWGGDQLLQSAWSYWELGTNLTCLYGFAYQSMFYAVVHDTTTGVSYLLKADLEDATFTTFGFNVYLDLLTKLVVNEDNQVTVPYNHEELVFVQADGCPNTGMLAQKVSNKSYTGQPYTHTFNEDFRGGTVYIGVPYRASYVPTEPIVRDGRGTPMTQGELRLNRYILTYRDSGYIQATTYSRYLDKVMGTLSGRIVGDDKNVIGVSPLIEGVVSIPVLQSPKNCHVEIHSDDFKPIRLVALEWEGSFSQGKRRL